FEQLAKALGGTSRSGLELQVLAKAPFNQEYDEATISLASQLVEANKTFRNYPEIAKRFFANFAQVATGSNQEIINSFAKRLEDQLKRVNEQQKGLEGKAEGDKAENHEQMLQLVEKQKNLLQSASAILKKYNADFQNQQALTLETIAKELAESKEIA